MAAGGKALEHVADAKAHPPVHLHVVLKVAQRFRIWEFPPDQQVGGFQKAAVGGQFINAIAAIAEYPPLAIDVADGGLGGGNAL